MLKQRVLTAIVLLLVLLGALLAPSNTPLLLLLVLIAACALWEWLRLVLPREHHRGAWITALAFGALLLTDQWFGLMDPCLATPEPDGGACADARALWIWRLQDGIAQLFIPLVALVWCIRAPLALMRADPLPRLRNPLWCWWQKALAHAPGAQGGVLRAAACGQAINASAAILAVWAALALLYQTHGAWLLVSLMALVWCADIAAYFTGRALGRHKLAAQVSPGKTWEGAAGGVLAAVVWTLASAQWQGSFGAALSARYSLVGTVFLAALLAALSIVGDLYESLLKRRAGVKDSSHLLPGHGGVLDRIDALLPVAPAAYCLLHFVP